MATTYNYSVPSIDQYQSIYYNAYLTPIHSSSTQFAVCQHRDTGDLVFKQGYCGNPSTGSWISTLKSNFSLDWSNDSTITDSSDIYFPIENNVIDWNNPFTPDYDYEYNGYYTPVNLVSGISKTIEDSSSSGGGSTEQPSGPCDNPYGSVVNAIYTCAAVPFVLGFFFVIYRMFMRLRG